MCLSVMVKAEGVKGEVGGNNGETTKEETGGKKKKDIFIKNFSLASWKGSRILRG